MASLEVDAPISCQTHRLFLHRTDQGQVKVLPLSCIIQPHSVISRPATGWRRLSRATHSSKAVATATPPPSSYSCFLGFTNLAVILLLLLVCVCFTSSKLSSTSSSSIVTVESLQTAWVQRSGAASRGRRELLTHPQESWL